MRSPSAASLLLSVLAGLSACKSEAPKPPPAPAKAEDVAFAGKVLGEEWHVTVRAATPERATAAKELSTALALLVDKIQGHLSLGSPDSELSKFNARLATDPVIASHELARAIDKALDIGWSTGGALDVTQGALLALWDFDRGGRRTVPKAEEIAAAQKRGGLGRVAVQGDRLVKSEPGATLDLSGVAHGYAIDAMAVLLDSKGFDGWKVEVGGDARAKGTSSRGTPWTVAVPWPQPGQPDAVVAVPISGWALATSSLSRGARELDGQRYSRVIDPASGAPLGGELASVAVVAEDGVAADGFATALHVTGEERARAILESRPTVQALFVYRDATGKPRASATPGFPKPTP